jgi:hypothetical protein
MYEDVESVCLFMGYTRSGHSLVGTILDAHPEAVIAHERAMFKVEHGDPPSSEVLFKDREKMFRALVATTEKHGARGRRGYRRTEPNKLIEGGANGSFTKLRVIGTKRGQETPPAWDANPQVFDQLSELAGAEVRLLHVYRNPWDNISSMTRAVTPAKAIRKYFKRAEVIKRFKAESSTPLLDIALEDLTANPREEIRRLAAFYGIEATDDYVEACAAVVDPEAQASRREREWTEEEIAAVQEAKQQIPWLERFPDSPAESRAGRRGGRPTRTRRASAGVAPARTPPRHQRRRRLAEQGEADQRPCDVEGRAVDVDDQQQREPGDHERRAQQELPWHRR